MDRVPDLIRALIYDAQKVKPVVGWERTFIQGDLVYKTRVGMVIMNLVVTNPKSIVLQFYHDSIGERRFFSQTYPELETLYTEVSRNVSSKTESMLNSCIKQLEEILV